MRATCYFAGLLAASLCAPAAAADILVPGGAATIADAVAIAQPGDRIVLAQDAVPYALDTLQIPVSLSIEAGDGLAPVVAIANGALRGMRLSEGVDITLRGFTLDGSANVPGVDLACPSIVLTGTHTIVVEDMAFLDASSRVFDGRNLTGPINLSIANSVFDGSGNRMIQLNNIPGGTSTVVIVDSSFSRAGDDAIALRNNALWNATLERNVLTNPIDPGADAFQIGGDSGSTFLLRRNIVHNWGDDAIQIESNAAASYEIVENTLYNVGTGVNIDSSGAFQGTVAFNQNLVVEWDQGLTGSAPPKGHALSDFLDDATWTSIANNAFVDADGTQFSVGATIAIDPATNFTGVNTGDVFLSTDPSSPDFLVPAPGGPAIDVAGSGLVAGAIQPSASVGDWMLLEN